MDFLLTLCRRLNGLLAEKYPVYAELRNVFDLALVAALIKAEGLPERVGWHMTCFAAPGKFPVAASQPPATRCCGQCC